MILKSLLTKVHYLWDPRPYLAKQWLDAAQKYPAGLKANTLVNPQIIESILQEIHRIHDLFQELLPEFKDQISIVPTNDVHAENLAVFAWENHIYVLVSAALIAKPIDHPELDSKNAWGWLALHEVSHVKSKDLPCLFQVRRLFKVSRFLFWISIFFYYTLPSNHLMEQLLNRSFWLVLGSFFIQLIVSITIELKADIKATSSIKDPLILEAAEKWISQMGSQAIKRFPQPFGFLNYLIHLLFNDPHPPYILRKWILRKYAKLLKNNSEKERQIF